MFAWAFSRVVILWSLQFKLPSIPGILPLVYPRTGILPLSWSLLNWHTATVLKPPKHSPGMAYIQIPEVYRTGIQPLSWNLKWHAIFTRKIKSEFWSEQIHLLFSQKRLCLGSEIFGTPLSPSTMLYLARERGDFLTLSYGSETLHRPS